MVLVSRNGLLSCSGFFPLTRFQAREFTPMKSFVAGVCFLLPLWLLATEDPVALKKELEPHQGVWQAVSYRIGEMETSKEIVDSIIREVKGDHVVWKRDGKSFAGTKMEVDPTKSPATIDLIPDGGAFKGEKVLGIYKIENDLLTLCMAPRGKPRPENWEAPKGSGISLMVFKKAPSPAKKP